MKKLVQKSSNFLTPKSPTNFCFHYNLNPPFFYYIYFFLDSRHNKYLSTSMDQLSHFCQKLLNWKQAESFQMITDLLESIPNIFRHPGQVQINQLLNVLIQFHKGINKCPNTQQIDEVWFKHVINAKKHLRGLREKSKKQKQKKLSLIDSNTLIKLPDKLIEGLKQPQKSYAQKLYSYFLMNMPHKMLEEKETQRVLPFIHKLLDEVEKLAPPSKKCEQFTFFQQLISKRIMMICEQLKKMSAKQAKYDMLEGIISPQQVVKGKQLAFLSLKSIEHEKQRIKKLSKESEANFYVDMKKEIEKETLLDCEFCFQKQAYFETNNSMTKFMTCSACKNKWKVD